MGAADELLGRLLRMGMRLPAGATLRRTYYRGSVAAGAWKWRVHGPDGAPFVELDGRTVMIGSVESMTALMRTPALGAYIEHRSGDVVVRERFHDVADQVITAEKSDPPA